MSFFIIPIEVVTRSNGLQIRQEKYVPALGVDRAIVDCDDTAIVWANCSPAQESLVASNPDVVLVPPLDNLIGAGALATVKSTVEALNIPSQWIQTGMSYRTVLRVIIGMAQLIQSLTGQGITVKLKGNLDKTLGSLSLVTRNAIINFCDSAQIESSNMLAGTTIREALRDFGQQFATIHSPRLGDL